MKRKRNYPSTKRINKTLIHVQDQVRQLMSFIDPPFKPEEIADAATTTSSIIEQLWTADRDGGRRSVLVPIMLYDSLLEESIKQLTPPSPAPDGNPYIDPTREEVK